MTRSRMSRREFMKNSAGAAGAYAVARTVVLDAALACHMANESYFVEGAVRWDAASQAIKS
jgi:hypothetical protein